MVALLILMLKTIFTIIKLVCKVVWKAAVFLLFKAVLIFPALFLLGMWLLDLSRPELALYTDNAGWFYTGLGLSVVCTIVCIAVRVAKQEGNDDSKK